MYINFSCSDGKPIGKAIEGFRYHQAGTFNLRKVTLRQFQLPMQSLEGLVRPTLLIINLSPLNKDVGRHSLPHVLKHVCQISLYKRNACRKYRVTCNTRNWKREQVGCMQTAPTTTIQTSKAQAATQRNQCECCLVGEKNCSQCYWNSSWDALPWDALPWDLLQPNTRTPRKSPKGTASIHLEARYAQQLSTYIVNDMHHNPD